MMAADNRSAYKWNQHPVISTVLWALETATIGASKKENVAPVTSALKWRDEEPSGKCSLNEYINVKPPADQPEIKAAEEGTQLRPNATRQDHEHFIPGRQYDNENGGPADYTPSPQWGFYVPITPPQAEMFSAKPVEQKSA
jgi:hypothetical protein